jgi:hypothetical protein
VVNRVDQLQTPLLPAHRSCLLLLLLCLQVDKVMESPGLQKVVNGVDQQLTWLQQHPQGRALWDLGSRLVRGGADAAGNTPSDAQATLEELRQQLTSLQVMPFSRF